MIRFVVIFLAVLLSFPAANAQESEARKTTFGFLVMGGARYDNVRMCAGSPAGVKGGPIGDVMLSINHSFNEKNSVVFNIPVMRPILFAAAHNMLQFEPEAIYEMHKILSDKKDFIHGPGVGFSANYGPDYKSSTENPTESFFAIGPIVNYQIGLEFKAKHSHTIALKTFYTPLFSFDGHDNGHVVGSVIQYSMHF